MLLLLLVWITSRYLHVIRDGVGVGEEDGGGGSDNDVFLLVVVPSSLLPG